MWSLASSAVRSVAVSVRRSVSVSLATRTLATQAALARSSPSLVARVCEVQGTDRARVSVSPLTSSLARAKVVGPSSLPALRPLSSLGGMSIVAYMALESNVGHFDMLQSWRPDLAKDLVQSISTAQVLRGELADAKDRIEDLEIMANDLTTFVERQKEEIAQLKRQVGW